MRRPVTTLMVAVGALCAAPLWAQSPAKYVDESGHVTYSDRPVPR